MNTCCNNCRYHDTETEKKISELQKAIDQNATKDFRQDGDITKLYNMYFCDVASSVKKYMDDLKEAGELGDLLNAILSNQDPYYSGISTEKKTAYNTDYYVTVVPRHDANGEPMRWKLGIANDDYNAASLESTIAFAHRKTATVAINCGVFDVDADKPIGVLIHNGRIVQTGIPEEGKFQYLAIMQDGSFRTYPRTTPAGTMIAQGATDVVCIFASLIENGMVAPQTDLRDEPRQSLGVRANGDVVIITVDGRKAGEDEGVSYAELALLQAAEGSENAWILDGGGSTATVIRGVKQNDNIDYYYVDRPVNTFLYVAKDTDIDPTTAPATDLGDVKQQLIELVMERKDFYNGFIRLRGAEGYYAPGVEMYVNAEPSRRSKIGLTIDKENSRNSYMYISFRGAAAELSNMFRIYDQGVYMQTYHGPSSERPNAPVGMMYFDETLNKPIWKGATGWVDATGASV